jgi:hypothetical protein
MGGENVRIELPTVLPAFSAVDVCDCARVELLVPKLNTISIFTTHHIKRTQRASTNLQWGLWKAIQRS